MASDDDEIYFQCPNCPATYGFKEFFELEHMAQASPADGRDVLGHAKCRKCGKEFYYYLTGDVFPIVVTLDFPDIPDEILFGGRHEEPVDFPLGDIPVPRVTPKRPDDERGDAAENKQDRISAKWKLFFIDGTCVSVWLNREVSLISSFYSP
jgi:hypothetical protein